MLIPALTLLERFEQRRQGLTGIGCHIWTGSRNSNGYGKLTIAGLGTYYAHRIAYGISYGHVPPELDHLCGNRACFNPGHLEPVSHDENCRRAGNTPTDFCNRGHRWDEEGWYQTKRGRKCKACHRIRARESARRKAARSNHDTRPGLGADVEVDPPLGTWPVNPSAGGQAAVGHS